MTQTGSVAEGRLSDWISLGVLASWVPRDAVDEAVEATGKAAKRKGGKLPPHVMVTTGLATCANTSLGHEPVREVFAQVARPVATEDTPGAFLGPWRKMSMDGLEWDIPYTGPNAAAFGYPGTGKDDAPAAFPKARAVTIGEVSTTRPHIVIRRCGHRRCHQRAPCRIGALRYPELTWAGTPQLVHLCGVNLGGGRGVQSLAKRYRSMRCIHWPCGMRRSCCIRPTTMPGAIPIAAANSWTSVADSIFRSLIENCGGMSVRLAKL